MSKWILLMWLACDAKGLTSIETKSYESCHKAGKQWKENDTSWLTCMHYKCIKVD